MPKPKPLDVTRPKRCSKPAHVSNASIWYRTSGYIMDLHDDDRLHVLILLQGSSKFAQLAALGSGLRPRM